jgi:hypothetical protein
MTTYLASFRQAMEMKKCEKIGVQTKFLANINNLVCFARFMTKKERKRSAAKYKVVVKEMMKKKSHYFLM